MSPAVHLPRTSPQEPPEGPPVLGLEAGEGTGLEAGAEDDGAGATGAKGTGALTSGWATACGVTEGIGVEVGAGAWTWASCFCWGTTTGGWLAAWDGMDG